MLDAGAIRRATYKDLDQMMEVEQRCFTSYLAYSRRQLQYLLTEAHSDCFAEVIHDALRGFIIVLYRENATVAGIETLNVDPLHHGKGIGIRLLQAAEEEMIAHDIRRIRLEVRTNNFPAINLYQRAGFETIAFLPNYYVVDCNGSRDAFRMVKKLT